MTFTTNSNEAPSPVDVHWAYEKARTAWRHKLALAQARQNQTLAVNSPGPFAIAFTADQHLGDSGTNIEQAFHELRVIRGMPHTRLWTVGDMLNQYIVGRLIAIHYDSEFTIPEEWALVKLYLKVAAPVLVGSTGGNHDLWIRDIAGTDYFEEVVDRLVPTAFYNRHESYLHIRHKSGVRWKARIRHKWRGSSIYNPTHGIERAAKWDADFELGVGAHIHTKACARSFTTGSQSGPLDGLAIQCGTYKALDEYKVKMGFAGQSRRSAAAAVIFDPELRTMSGYDNIHAAAKVMRGFYP